MFRKFFPVPCTCVEGNVRVSDRRDLVVINRMCIGLEVQVNNKISVIPEAFPHFNREGEISIVTHKLSIEATLLFYKIIYH